jgi:hypothetical protein
MHTPEEFLEVACIIDELQTARKRKPKARKKTAKQLQLEADIRTAEKIFEERKKARGESKAPNPDRRIFSGLLPKVHPTKRILESVFEGKGWHDATLTQAERDAAAKAAEEERTGLVEIPEPEWGPDK